MTELLIKHQTTYRYSARVDVAYHWMHLTPHTSAHQQVVSHALTIDPAPDERSVSVDSFDNACTFCALAAPHDALKVMAESCVVVQPRFADLAPERSPPWEEVQHLLRYTVGAPFVAASEFAFASPFVPVLSELREYARASMTPRRPWIAAAIDLMQRIHEDFDYDPHATDVATPLAQAFRQRRGVCQDFAHVMIGCLRALGLPAAYVSGYLLTQPPPGQPRLLGADASHAWVSVWCPELGWVDLDPTNNVIADSTHVTLAIGRDYGDVMPLRGVIRGGGSHTLAVAVSVVPAGEEITPKAPAAQPPAV
jgi:transglutaminase-like putative cysteine protease